MYRRCRTLEDTRMIIGTLRDYHTGRDPRVTGDLSSHFLTGLQKSEQKKRRAPPHAQNAQLII